jgi:hypothetical protein
MRPDRVRRDVLKTLDQHGGYLQFVHGRRLKRL